MNVDILWVSLEHFSYVTFKFSVGSSIKPNGYFTRLIKDSILVC
jgi:hypothetical protein